jgi:hypothetical protein
VLGFWGDINEVERNAGFTKKERPVRAIPIPIPRKIFFISFYSDEPRWGGQILSARMQENPVLPLEKLFKMWYHFLIFSKNENTGTRKTILGKGRIVLPEGCGNGSFDLFFCGARSLRH